MINDRFQPIIVKPYKTKFNPNAYSVEWTDQGTPVYYYNDGRVALNYKIEVVVELPKKLAKALNKARRGKK
jgi:ABC-type thiamine transport system substrate-binding protein